MTCRLLRADRLLDVALLEVRRELARDVPRASGVCGLDLSPIA
jgi:hypothetical protein